MSDWTAAELASISRIDELHLSSRRADGTLRAPVTIWVVEVGGEVLVRSARGRQNDWFRRARDSGSGHIRIGAVDCDVAFDTAAAATPSEIDSAYRAKYSRYGATIVNSVAGPHAAELTLRLTRSS